MQLCHPMDDVGRLSMAGIVHSAPGDMPNIGDEGKQIKTFKRSCVRRIVG